MAQHLPYLATALIAAIVIFLIMKVGQARGKYKVPAPSTTGPIEFERVLRAQANTTESLVCLLPLLWTFSIYVSPLWGGILGLIWAAARVGYIQQYSAGKNRTVTFAINGIICVIFLAGSLFGIARAMLS